MENSMKKRVLLIDDEARVRASLKAVLEPTYETIQAADAQEGLALVRKEATPRRAVGTPNHARRESYGTGHHADGNEISQNRRRCDEVRRSRLSFKALRR